jgi:hypothetical protein
LRVYPFTSVIPNIRLIFEKNKKKLDFLVDINLNIV